MNTCQCTEKLIDYAVVDRILADVGTDGRMAIPVLQAVQNALRYIPRDVIAYIAQKTEMTEAQLFGVATFYTQFRLEPVGEKIIKVCHGTACHVGGAEGVTEELEKKLGVRAGDTTADGKYTLSSVACVGCCSLAPVMMVDDQTYARLDRRKAAQVIDQLSAEESS